MPVPVPQRDPVRPRVRERGEQFVRAPVRQRPVRAGADPDLPVVLVGRGSTDPDACADVVKFARLLGDGRGLGLVETAFVAMSEPSIEQALDRCRRLGARRVAVVPLFLFPGVLVDRIADRAASWAAAHGAPATADAEMARAQTAGLIRRRSAGRRRRVVARRSRGDEIDDGNRESPE